MPSGMAACTPIPITCPTAHGAGNVTFAGEHADAAGRRCRRSCEPPGPPVRRHRFRHRTSPSPPAPPASPARSRPSTSRPSTRLPPHRPAVPGSADRHRHSPRTQAPMPARHLAQRLPGQRILLRQGFTAHGGPAHRRISRTVAIVVRRRPAAHSAQECRQIGLRIPGTGQHRRPAPVSASYTARSPRPSPS